MTLPLPRPAVRCSASAAGHACGVSSSDAPRHRLISWKLWPGAPGGCSVGRAQAAPEQCSALRWRPPGGSGSAGGGAGNKLTQNHAWHGHNSLRSQQPHLPRWWHNSNGSGDAAFGGNGTNGVPPNGSGDADRSADGSGVGASGHRFESSYAGASGGAGGCPSRWAAQVLHLSEHSKTPTRHAPPTAC